MANTLRTGTPEFIRDINRESVIQTIMEKGPISRAAVAAHLGLTKATVSAIVQTLIDRGLVVEMENEESEKSTARKGRRPIFLRMEENCGHIVSVDLAADTITIMTANLLGHDSRIYQVDFPKDEKNLVSVLISSIQEATKELPESRYGLLGIMLIIHGVVHHNKIIFLPYASYENQSLTVSLKEAFGVPVLMENEANLSVLGEWHFCHKTDEMLFISVHSGIGVGILMRGQLVKGKNGYAGEFGHTIIHMDGRPCPCGNHGCLEQYASERALFAEMGKLKGRNINADLFEELYLKGDADAHRLVDDFVRYMAVGINNMLNTFNPDIIVLNSVLNRCRPSLCEDITSALRTNMQQYCRLIPSVLQDTSSLLGGIYVIQNRFLYPTRI